MIHRCLAVIFGLFTLAFGAVADASELVVFDRGEARIAVGNPPQDGSDALTAALGDLRRCFKAMTGADLPGQAAAGMVPVRFRIVPTSQPLTAGQAAHWPRYKVHVSSSEVVIEAYSALGLANGVYAMLDHWGCRWVMPGAIGEVIPQADSLSLPMGTMGKGRMADMRHTIISPRDPETALWIRRNRNGTERVISCYHNWIGRDATSIVPESIYNNPEKPETYRPQYYSLVGGKRIARQICTSNPEVIALGIRAAKEFFKRYPNSDAFPVDPNDNIDFCQCEECRKLDPEGVTPEGLPKMTDRVISFANAIARGIRGEYPGKKVGLYSYMNHTLPPERVKPEPELIIGVTRSNYDLLRLVPREEGDSASQFYGVIKSWRKLGVSVFTYEYNPIYWNLNLPCPNYLEFAQTARDALGLGCGGIYTDGYIQIDNRTNFLNYYLLFRVNLNPDLDPRAELRDLCLRFYGPAGETMARYYETLAKVVDARLPAGAVMGGGLRHYAEMFDPGMMREAQAALDEARKASPGEGVYRERLELARLNQRYLGAFLAGVWKGGEGDFEGSNAAFDEMEALVPTMGEVGLLSKKSVFGVADTQTRLAGARLMFQANAFPDRYGMIRKWRMLGPFDNSSRGAEVEKDPFEPLSDIDRPVRLASGQSLAWREVSSPTGFVDLRKCFGKAPSNWSAFYVYLGVKVKSPHKQRVELRMDSFNAFRVYLNGREVFYRPGWDNDLPDKRKVPVILEAGENTIVVKCTHTSDTYSFPWGLFFRITGRSGEPVGDLAYTP